MTVKNKGALRSSLARMLEWDFDRLVVGHGDPINTGAKARVVTALQAAGYEIK